MKIKLAISALGLVMVSGLSHAENRTHDSCQLGNVYEDIECYEQDNKRLIKELNGIYKKLQSLPAPAASDKVSYGASKAEYLKAFTESQTAWNKFTEANCSMLLLPASTLQGGGIGLVQRACWNEAYQQRVEQLNEWLDEIHSNE